MQIAYVSPLLICAVMSLSGCATRPTAAAFDERAERWIGKNADDLIVAKGPPTSSATLSNGSRVLQYERFENVISGGSSYNVPTSNYVFTGPAAGTYQQGTAVHTTPVRSKTLNCSVRFTVDTSNTIIGWSKDGNNCVARPDAKK